MFFNDWLFIVECYFQEFGYKIDTHPLSGTKPMLAQRCSGLSYIVYTANHMRRPFVN